MKSSADMIFIVDLWRVPYNIPTSKVCHKAGAIIYLFIYFKLNGNIYPGINLQNLKRGVLKTMFQKATNTRIERWNNC